MDTLTIVCVLLVCSGITLMCCLCPMTGATLLFVGLLLAMLPSFDPHPPMVALPGARQDLTPATSALRLLVLPGLALCLAMAVMGAGLVAWGYCREAMARKAASSEERLRQYDAAQQTAIAALEQHLEEQDAEWASLRRS